MHEHIGCSFNQLWVVLLLQVVCKSGFKDLFPNTVQQSGANIPGQRVLLELPWQSWGGRRPGCRGCCQHPVEAPLCWGSRIYLAPSEMSSMGVATQDCVLSYKIKGMPLNVTYC